ncbi:uncharacterized protein LOC106766561 isoform X2 [Vigna radiata var. radiata]|uniref:Uncharacterized protein LOC106766561 isoform X2 n=1 Tax=Vigna radiata var. radiata TaxID=3916 RepID=A0A1S3UL40_VIGRR|nr:uncharacterized protein LOC106766561 isoform X2 [Vigna radiata var. radiata]
MCRMEREEERERRRLRDRQRRQSMTKEQRERHLARRRRNYQLRRQRAANTPLPPLPQSTSSQPSHDTLQILQDTMMNNGASIEMEGFPKRLSIVKRLARNFGNTESVTTLDSYHLAPDFISGKGGTTNILRLNSVKRLARSLSFAVEKQPS